MAIGGVSWVSPAGLLGVAPLATLERVAVGPGPHERSSLQLDSAQLHLDPLASLLQRKLALKVSARGAKVVLVQQPNFSWFGYPNASDPAMRDILPGLQQVAGSAGGRAPARSPGQPFASISSRPNGGDAAGLNGTKARHNGGSDGKPDGKQSAGKETGATAHDGAKEVAKGRFLDDMSKQLLQGAAQRNGTQGLPTNGTDATNGHGATTAQKPAPPTNGASALAGLHALDGTNALQHRGQHAVSPLSRAASVGALPSEPSVPSAHHVTPPPDAAAPPALAAPASEPAQAPTAADVQHVADVDTAPVAWATAAQLRRALRGNQAAPGDLLPAVRPSLAPPRGARPRLPTIAPATAQQGSARPAADAPAQTAPEEADFLARARCGAWCASFVERHIVYIGHMYMMQGMAATYRCARAHQPAVAAAGSISDGIHRRVCRPPGALRRLGRRV